MLEPAPDGAGVRSMARAARFWEFWKRFLSPRSCVRALAVVRAPCCWCAHSELSNEQSEEVPLESSHPGLAPGPTGHACVQQLTSPLFTHCRICWQQRSQHDSDCHSSLAAAAVGRVC